MSRYDAADSLAPTSNSGHWSNAEASDPLREAQTIFDPLRQSSLPQEARAIVLDKPASLLTDHDLSPRAISHHAAGFHPSQSRGQDFTRISMA